MAASAAESGTGSTFTWNSVLISETNVVGDVDQTSDDIEVTHYTSDDGFKEFIQGLRDAGEVTIEGNFLSGDSGQASLLADYYTGVTRTGLITYPNTDASTWTFTAYVKSFAPSTPIGDKIGFTATVRITGKADFAV